MAKFNIGKMGGLNLKQPTIKPSIPGSKNLLNILSAKKKKKNFGGMPTNPFSKKF